MTDTMEWLELKGHITEDGKLEIELPQNVESGDVDVLLKLKKPIQQQVETNTEAIDEISTDEPSTEDEIRAALKFEGKTVGEILSSGLIGAWSDVEIDDPVEWLHEKRRKEQDGKDLTW